MKMINDAIKTFSVFTLSLLLIFGMTPAVTIIASVQTQNQQFTVITHASPSNGGKVTGSKTYNVGTTATMTATPNDGWTFNGWYDYYGKFLSANMNYSFIGNIANARYTIEARFSQTQNQQNTMTQNPQSTVSAQDDRPYNFGSGETLAGNVYVVSFFISDSNNKWTYAEKTQMIKLRNDAQEWLKNQALPYDVMINFENKNYGLNNDIKINSIPSMLDEGDTEMVSTVLNKIGWDSSLRFYEAQKEITNCDNMLVLIFVKGSGQSYSLSYEDTGMNRELYYLEGSVIFQKYSSINTNSPAGVIAHEILHMFGAWDLYETYRQKSDAIKNSSEIFPDSIMHRMSYDIDDLNIDELTAWLVGWHGNAKSWYEDFNPNPQ